MRKQSALIGDDDLQPDDLDQSPGLPTIDAVDSQALDENFPVALAVLPRRIRSDLTALYGFARLVDDIGDDYTGDRCAALDWVEHDLERATAGTAKHPAIARLSPTIRRHQLDLQPFRDLIEANRRDQFQHRYANFDDLLRYCALSANPVGRLVLAIFDIDDRRAQILSDDVCSGLQVVEHLQDVGEDAATGRIYLPRDDMTRFNCSEADLERAVADPALRRLVAFEADRARSLLASGRELQAMLPIMARVAVTGFVAGGLAAIDAIGAADFDVLGRRCRPTRRQIARRAIGLRTFRRPTDDRRIVAERTAV